MNLGTIVTEIGNDLEFNDKNSLVDDLKSTVDRLKSYNAIDNLKSVGKQLKSYFIMAESENLPEPSNDRKQPGGNPDNEGPVFGGEKSSLGEYPI